MLGLTALLVCAADLRAQTLSSINLYRGQVGVQTDASTVSSPSNPLYWGVEVRGTGLTGPVITIPVVNGTNNAIMNSSQHNGGVLGFNSSDGAFEYGSPNFDNISFPLSAGGPTGDRNVRFPIGTYTIAFPSTSLTTVSLDYKSLTVTSMQYTLTNGTGGSWSGGNYYFDPTQPLTI